MLKNSIAQKIFKDGSDLELKDSKVTVKISDLSRKSGVNIETLSKILRGDTQNPGVYTIAQIANALDCSVGELIDDCNIGKKTELKTQLARSCVTTITNLLHHAKHKVSLDDFLCILKEVYTHSLNKKNKAVDTDFASQYIDQLLKSKKC